MDLKTFGRHLGEVLAERTLNVIRSTNVEELRHAVQGATPESRMLSSVAMGLGVFALGAVVGAGITALYTPTTGPQLRKRLGKGARDAQKQALEMGHDVRDRLDDARTSMRAELGRATKNGSSKKKMDGMRTRTRKPTLGAAAEA